MLCVILISVYSPKINLDQTILETQLDPNTTSAHIHCPLHAHTPSSACTYAVLCMHIRRPLHAHVLCMDVMSHICGQRMSSSQDFFEEVHPPFEFVSSLIGTNFMSNFNCTWLYTHKGRSPKELSLMLLAILFADQGRSQKERACYTSSPLPSLGAS